MKPALLLLAFLLADAQACGNSFDAKARRSVHAEGLTLAFAPQPAPVRIGQHFAVEIEVCVADGAAKPTAITVDAEMPAHRHGMNYRPRIEAQSPGRWRASGLMFHMPGQWRYRFDLTFADSRRLRLAEDVQID
jgi:hypothetical protein